MTDALDQIFVTTKQFLVAFLAGLFPPAWQPLATLLISAVVMVAAIIGVFATLFAITTVL